MERFQQVFASLASPFASLAYVLSVAVVTFCAICAIFATRALYVRRVIYIYVYFSSLAYDIINMTKMTKMAQIHSQAIDIIDKSFCVTLEAVAQVTQKPFVLLEKVGLSWI